MLGSMNLGGRPSKFSQAIAEEICKLAIRGATIPEIAEVVGVTERTVYEWRAKDADFKAQLDACRDIATGEVEAALFRRATGYDYEEEKLTYDSELKEWVRTTTVKHVPSDTGAATFWLTNRGKKQWANKIEQHVTGATGPQVHLHLPERMVEVQEKVLAPKAELPSLIASPTDKKD